MGYPPLIVYIAAAFYNFVNIFTNVPLIVTCFWLPAFIGPVSGIIAYLFVRRFTNEYGGFAAGLFTVTVPFYFLRTVPGWFDTDMFNVLFPLLIMWFIVEAVSNENPKKSAFFAVLSAFSTAIFSIAWNGWSYVFYIILASFLIYIVTFKVVSLRKSKNFHLKHILKIFLIYLLSTITFLFFFGTLVKLLVPLTFLRATVQSTWPNINVSVDELAEPSFDTFVEGLGVVFFVGVLGFIGILGILTKKSKKIRSQNLSWFFYVLLVIWTLVGVISLNHGSRFVMFLIPPLVLSSGIMIGIFAEYLEMFQGNKKFRLLKNKHIKTVILVILLILVVIPSVLISFKNVPFLSMNGLNDDMNDASAWLNQNTTNDTVIFSEWSYGHFFTAFADRPFSVDGGSTNTPREYWLDKAFSTNNESLSLGIFNMLATTGDLGYLTLDNYTKNSTKTVEILNNILGVNNSSAFVILVNRYGLSSDQAKKILNITHPKNPRPFVILTYDNMVINGYWDFYFGSWDFNKMTSENFTYSYGSINSTGNILKTNNGIQMNFKSANVTWKDKEPYSVTLIHEGKVEKKYLNKTSNSSVILNLDSKKALAINKRFENSLFVSLVLKKSGDTYFEPVYRTGTVTIWRTKKNI